jgi:hypothetical protein
MRVMQLENHLDQKLMTIALLEVMRTLSLRTHQLPYTVSEKAVKKDKEEAVMVVEEIFEGRR